MMAATYGDSYLSDESDFYGDHETRTGLEIAARRPLKRGFEPPFPPTTFKKIKTTHARPSGGQESNLEPVAAPKKEESVLNFLRNRPQVAEHRKAHDQPKKGPSETSAKSNSAERVKVDFFDGVGDGAWKQSETVAEFLRRLPLGDPSTVTLDGWIWVGTPELPRAHLRHKKQQNTTTFTTEGYNILQRHDETVVRIKADNAKLAQSTLSRKITPHRLKLAEDLLACAVDTKVTSAKWMLFPNTEDLPHFWQKVATATAAGKLGPMSKVATYTPSKPETLICVYTYDFSDMKDVRRVLHELADLGLCSSNSRPIYYKCDAYTLLGIESSNEWGLRASLFSSKEVLDNQFKALQNGPLAKLKDKKQSRMVDEFLDGFRGDID